MIGVMAAVKKHLKSVWIYIYLLVVLFIGSSKIYAEQQEKIQGLEKLVHFYQEEVVRIGTEMQNMKDAK